MESKIRGSGGQITVICSLDKEITNAREKTNRVL